MVDSGNAQLLNSLILRAIVKHFDPVIDGYATLTITVLAQLEMDIFNK